MFHLAAMFTALKMVMIGFGTVVFGLALFCFATIALTVSALWWLFALPGRVIRRLV